MLRLLEGKEKLTPHPNKIELIRGLIGGTISIYFLIYLSHITDYLWIMAPFGASCVILYAAAQSPLAQPRNIIFGHIISAFIGLFFLKNFGSAEWSIALSVGLSIFIMQYLKCIHPPAGANPLVILLTAPHINYSWDFLLFPVLSGAVVLVSIAYIINNILSPKKWPMYCLALFNTRTQHTQKK